MIGPSGDGLKIELSDNKSWLTLFYQLPREILDILREKGVSPSDWIFTRDGERITGRQANYVLEKFAKDTGRMVKSSHKLRKTCGSRLHAKGLSPKQCADYLGNTPEVFLRNYCFDTTTDDELLALLDA